MPGLLYYFPGESRHNVQDAKELPHFNTHLQHLAGGSFDCRQHAKGPEGTEGFMVAVQDLEGKVLVANYDAEKQDWYAVKQDDKPLYWIGWEKKAKPGPKDLARKKQLRGHEVKLNDGNEWLIPVVGPAFSNLPQEFVVNDKGECELAVEKRYMDVFKMSEKFFEYVNGDGKAYRTDICQYLAKVIGLNYMVGLHECSQPVLNLINSSTYMEPVEVSIATREWNAYMEAKKKTEAEQQSTT